MSNPIQLTKDLRVILARLNEQCPDHAALVGVFSAPANGQLLYEFMGSGQEKLDERMKLPQGVFYKIVLPKLCQEFEEHHKSKPAFIIEWFITQSGWKQGSAALAEVIATHICNEAALHETPPDDLLDLELTTHCLSAKERPASETPSDLDNSDGPEQCP